MKTLIVLLLAATLVSCQNVESDTLYISTWNIENLFDTVDDPDKNDEDFLPDGRKEWTQDKLELKLDNLAKVIKSMNEGAGPDVLGMQEVENQAVAEELMKLLDKKYKLVYAESPDGRGIDNCLLYNSDKLGFISQNAITVTLADNWPTRDIIVVNLKNQFDDTLSVFINHWPSRSGGQEKSEPNRIAAGTTLKNYMIENNFCTSDKFSIILGDFNDEPDNVSIADHLGAVRYSCDLTVEDCKLYNLAYQMAADSLGSYFYRGDWNMLDQIIVSHNVAAVNTFNYICDSFNIYKPEFMVTLTGFYKGSAIPTFGGKNYLKGYSDHFPVYARFIMKGK